MAKRISIEQLAQLTEERIKGVEEKMDKGFKAVLDAIENIDARITDLKQSTVSALDYARLETRVEALEKKIEKINA